MENYNSCSRLCTFSLLDVIVQEIVPPARVFNESRIWPAVIAREIQGARLAALIARDEIGLAGSLVVSDRAIISIALFGQSKNFNEPTAELDHGLYRIPNEASSPSSFDKITPVMPGIWVKFLWDLLVYTDV